MYIDGIHECVNIYLFIQVLRTLPAKYELSVVMMLHPFIYTYISYHETVEVKRY